MTEGTSQGLFVVVAIVIFGIFIGLTYTLFGSEGLNNDLENIFTDSIAKSSDIFDETIYTSEDLFTFDVETRTITNYSTEGSKDIVIPRTINGVTVRKIGSSAFLNKGLTSVVFPDTITEIEDSKVTYKGAFTGNNLGDFTVPGSLEKLGNYSFTGAGITELTLEEGVEEIKSHAFHQNSIKELVIPNSMRYIGAYAFTGVGLTSLELGNGLEGIGGWAFRSNNIGELTIPKSVTKLSNQFLEHNIKVTKLNIPNELKESIEKDTNHALIKTSTYDSSTATFINLVYFEDNIVNYY